MKSLLAGLKSWLFGIRARLRSEMIRTDLRHIVLVFAGTTCLLWLVAYGAATVFQEPVKGRWHYTSTRALDVWARWDSVCYVEIARHGYKEGPGGADMTPWFPLYPYLIRFLTPRVEHHYLAGQLISLTCFFLLLCAFYDVIQETHGRKIAQVAVWYLSIFPSALYFRAVYAESLFTLVLVLSYRAFLREQYFRCGLYGAMAAMTRIPGIMLLPAFAGTLVWEIGRKRKAFRSSMIFIGLIGLGLAVVMVIQYRETGDALAFLHSASRSDLDRVLVFPGVSVIGDIGRMIREWNFRKGAIEFHLIIDDIVAVLAVVGAIYFFRRYGFLAGALSLALLLPPLVSGRTIGMIRYVLPIFFFPLYLAELGERHPWFHNFWVFFSSLLLAFYMICFACWYWTA